MIERILLPALDQESDTMTAPPQRFLEVEVIAGIAHLALRQVDAEGRPGALEADISVVASSLLFGVEAGIRAEEAPRPDGLRGNL